MNFGCRGPKHPKYEAVFRGTSTLITDAVFLAQPVHLGPFMRIHLLFTSSTFWDVTIYSKENGSFGPICDMLADTSFFFSFFWDDPFLFGLSQLVLQVIMWNKE